ncbi:MAG: hypothetical protein ACFFB0_06735 [Promethearchaeota archaeon]
MPTVAAQNPDILFAVALIIEYGMMAVFLTIVIYPLNSIYRKTEIGFKEIILASPATPGDIFIGEFIGKVPIYFLGVLLIAPIIIGMLNPIINLNFIQYIVIYVCITILIMFATLLGSILASWIEHKIAKSERARDWGKVILFILAIIMVVMVYSLQFLFKFLMDNPKLRNWVMFYPSLWFTNIILYVIDPILISGYILDIWWSISLCIIVPLGILYLSFKKAENFFTVEGGIERITSVIEKENKFYLIIRKLSGHKWEGLINAQLKEFLRRRENIMKIVYTTSIVGILGVLFPLTFGTEIGFIGESLIVVILIYIGGMLYGMLFGSYIFVGNKDLLWVYKRSPRNISALVYSYLISMLIFNILITIGLTFFFALFMKFDFFTTLFFFCFFVLNCEIVISQSIGIQCFNPSFEEKGRIMTTNILMLMVLQMVPFQSIFILIILLFPRPSTPIIAKFLYLTPLLLVSLSIAIPLLYFGVKSLSKRE